MTEALLGGWTVSGIYASRSGRPFTVNQSSNNVGQRHDRAAEPRRRRRGTGDGGPVVRPRRFQAVTSGTFGNAGRNILRGPDWQSLDLSLQTNFRCAARPDLRWDVFNLFNTANLGLPDANIANTATVGQIRSLSGDPRLMQFSVRFQF